MLSSLSNSGWVFVNILLITVLFTLSGIPCKYVLNALKNIYFVIVAYSHTEIKLTNLTFYKKLFHLRGVDSMLENNWDVETIATLKKQQIFFSIYIYFYN